MKDSVKWIYEKPGKGKKLKKTGKSEETTMTDASVMGIFDVIILAFGLYLMYIGVQMKKKGTISTTLINESDINRIFDKAGFIDAIYGKTMIFAGIITAYGFFGLIDDYVLEIPYIGMAGMFIFIVAMVWYFHELRKAKAQFVK